MNVTAEDRSKGIEPLEVLQLCKDFLGNKWSAVTEDNFDFKVLTQGLGNRLFVVGVKEGTADKVEPNKVLVRYYGGNFLPRDMPMRTLTEAGEVLTFHCLSQYGLGPKLFGVFKEGRIEEFIPSTNFSMDTFCDDEQASEAIARVLARFHAVDIPVRKAPLDGIKIIRDATAKFLAVRDTLPSPTPANEKEADILLEIKSFQDGLLGEVDWLEKTLAAIESRVVFAHNDANRSNMIIRNDDGSNQPLEKRLILIDYEFNGYHYRGSDIANHFLMKVLDFGSPEPFTGRAYPTVDKRRHFIEKYLDECKSLPAFSQDWNQDGGDSVDHVLKESSFHALINGLVMFTWGLGRHAQEAPSHEGPNDREITGPAGFVQSYKERKAEFLASYPQYA